jgi:hypothetical protein
MRIWLQPLRPRPSLRRQVLLISILQPLRLLPLILCFYCYSSSPRDFERPHWPKNNPQGRDTSLFCVVPSPHLDFHGREYVPRRCYCHHSCDRDYVSNRIRSKPSPHDSRSVRTRSRNAGDHDGVSTAKQLGSLLPVPTAVVPSGGLHRRTPIRNVGCVVKEIVFMALLRFGVVLVFLVMVMMITVYGRRDHPFFSFFSLNFRVAAVFVALCC